MSPNGTGRGVVDDPYIQGHAGQLVAGEGAPGWPVAHDHAKIEAFRLARIQRPCLGPALYQQIMILISFVYDLEHDMSAASDLKLIGSHVEADGGVHEGDADDLRSGS